MPTSALKHLASKRHISMDHAEHLWDRAKGIVSAEYGSRENVKGYWALVMGITKKMMGMHEALTFKEFLLSEQEEGTQMKLDHIIEGRGVAAPADTAAYVNKVLTHADRSGQISVRLAAEMLEHAYRNGYLAGYKDKIG